MLGNVDTRGKGYGKDAVMATMRYAFEELNLHRLDGQMIEYNTGSVEFYCDKLGWKREGVARDWYYTKGRYWDKVMVGITHQDYTQLLDETRYWDE
jgi:RimJ/RimL family protein N-acetyltransferase